MEASMGMGTGTGTSCAPQLPGQALSPPYPMGMAVAVITHQGSPDRRGVVKQMLLCSPERLLHRGRQTVRRPGCVVASVLQLA
jgi:hypothetical protein